MRTTAADRLHCQRLACLSTVCSRSAGSPRETGRTNSIPFLGRPDPGRGPPCCEPWKASPASFIALTTFRYRLWVPLGYCLQISEILSRFPCWHEIAGWPSRAINNRSIPWLRVSNLILHSPLIVLTIAFDDRIHLAFPVRSYAFCMDIGH